MRKMKQGIVRSIRLEKSLDDLIIAIAEHEDRSFSQAVRRLLNDGMQNYIRNNPDFSISTAGTLSA